MTSEERVGEREREREERARHDKENFESEPPDVSGEVKFGWPRKHLGACINLFRVSIYKNNNAHFSCQ